MGMGALVHAYMCIRVQGAAVATGRTGDVDVNTLTSSGAPIDGEAKLQYDEFEKLLAQRDEKPVNAKPGAPKPEKDTRRAVDARRLNNLGPLNR